MYSGHRLDNAFFLITLNLLYCCTTYSASDSEKIARLKCDVGCFDIRRVCYSPPDLCGECVTDHVDIDGQCRARSMIVAESDPDVRQSIKRALEVEEKKLETRDNINQGPLARDKDQLPPVLSSQGLHAGVRQQPGSVGMSAGSYVKSGTTPQGAVVIHNNDSVINDVVFIAVIAVFCAAAVIGIVVAIICCCRMRRSAKESGDFDYTSYGTNALPPAYSSTKPPAMDRKLAQSAQMFHYQQQKQQMLEMEKAQEMAAKSDDDATSEDENTDSHYTVYECPGLANTGEMEVRNPLYTESPLPPVTATTMTLPDMNGLDSTADSMHAHVVNGEH